MTMVPLYAVTICDAMERKDASVDELVKLRDQTHELIAAQGDLAGSLVRLQQEIDRKKG